ncbi:hypothetical protein MRB53_024464 [Persea americana]|uniref:Uncharacterized protein n=1 Tax=Persea americana TaxID=3435 RepID=A0ACC2LCJ0_PERAE|nr:hypothetical protein MRB53_024464 [Persea americana]|eukprot:TRINITY_DN24958_c0_g1_i1.p1 TRINITY_DN24958_c0_g1~~TRINITY_DN24958_c0_g1_i1.p1  ORF type:complete len:123 (-),score=15.94 TRINITY_DN24958_c0_g1_i1:215-583(-)
MLKVLGPVLIVVAMVIQIDCAPARNLDESLPTPPASGCTMCSSCNNPCNQQPPPPPPSKPHPPKKPPKSHGPPPPPPPFYIIGGPPGDLYPISESYGNRNLVVELPILVGCGLLGLLAFWRL